MEFRSPSAEEVKADRKPYSIRMGSDTVGHIKALSSAAGMSIGQYVEFVVERIVDAKIEEIRCEVDPVDIDWDGLKHGGVPIDWSVYRHKDEE